jgi:spermidine/putrescine transport system substrate-binding protein
MKKIISIIAVLAMVMSVFAGCGSASTGSSSTDGESSSSSQESTAAGEAEGSTELNLYTWEGMFPQEVLDDFTAQTGIKVNYSNFDYDETMLAKLETSKGGDYDLVIADDYIIETAISEGLAQKLDKTQIANYGNINPLYQGQFFDSTNEYTVPYGAGVQTIVYNPNSVDVEINGYADLWDASLKSNVGIIANYRVIDGMALKILGESYNTTDIATIDKAGEKLNELAPNIRLIKDDNIQDDLISGEIGAAVMYTSQVTTAMMTNPELKVVYPEEGIGFGIMAQFIPSNAPHADAAHKFIDYILDPEVSAKCYEFLGYYCTNLAAEEYINSDYASFLTLPSDFTSDNMEMIENISAEADEEHVKVWTEFKTAAE